jgi:arylsulfatase A-like enzyme
MVSMDFLPTLLAATGGTPDPAYPSDGENLLPVLLGQQSPHMRKLFWRYKASEQAAAREGDWKYLKMADQEFLFNVAEDQRERANLKGKMPDLFERLKKEYAVWNAAMLPYPAGSFSENPKGQWADRY